VFYVKDVFGMKIDREERIEALRAKLLDAIASDGPEPEPEHAPDAETVKAAE